MCVSDFNMCVHVVNEMPVICRDTPTQLHSNNLSESECVREGVGGWAQVKRVVSAD